MRGLAAIGSMPVRTNYKIMEYKNFSIIEDHPNPYSKKPQFMFYPTEEGADHDYDLVGEDYKYCGNCKWADTLEEAIESIDELSNWVTKI